MMSFTRATAFVTSDMVRPASLASPEPVWIFCTDDEIRSLAISQRLLGTTEIILIHHTGCGLLNVTEESFKRDIQNDTGIRPSWSVEAFTDVYEDVRQSIARIKASPFVPNKDHIRGFVFDVSTGKLNEVI